MGHHAYALNRSEGFRMRDVFCAVVNNVKLIEGPKEFYKRVANKMRIKNNGFRLFHNPFSYPSKMMIGVSHVPNKREF